MKLLTEMDSAGLQPLPGEAAAQQTMPGLVRALFTHIPAQTTKTQFTNHQTVSSGSRAAPSTEKSREGWDPPYLDPDITNHNGGCSVIKQQ